MEWVTVVGLVLDIIGAAVLSYGLIVRESAAIKLSLSTRGVKPDREHPQVQDRMRQSRNAAIGLVLLVAGFTLQIIAAWP
jgi:hypothetical protein